MAENPGIPVMIHLASLVSYDGVADDPIQMITSGLLFPGDAFSILRYQEVLSGEGDSGMSKSDVQMVLKKDQVTMNRIGEYANTMLFQKNRRYETVYRTPYGEMNMSVFSREVRWIQRDDGGSIHLRYDLSMEGQYTSSNEMHMEYWHKEPGAQSLAGSH